MYNQLNTLYLHQISEKGAKEVPFFYCLNMSIEQTILELLNDKFLEPEFQDCFCLEVKETQKGRKIEVYIDCDDGVTFQRCQRISRYLEEHLDESSLVKENYILEVSSPGADRPITLARQYPKHIGRKLQVKLTSGEELEGRLTDVTDNGIVLNRRIVERQGKRKIRKRIESEIDFSAIDQSKVKLTFQK